MKRLAILLLIAGIFIFCSSNAFARAIGLKIIYNDMMADYSDAKYDNNISLGLFFDYGKFGFESMDFRPGIDYVKLKNDYGTWATVYGIHFDWYWFFLQKGIFAPYIGFGPALNYCDLKRNDKGFFRDDESQAGIEGFGGCEFAVSGPFKIQTELRFVLHDIANIDQQIFKVCVGGSYSF